MNNELDTKSTNARKSTKKVKDLNKSNGPCITCGSLQLVPSSKYHMEDDEESQRNSIDSQEARDNYISSLLQQIKLLELEVSYLKNHHRQYHSKRPSSQKEHQDPTPSGDPRPLEVNNNSSTDNGNFVKEMTLKLEASVKERTRLQGRISTLEAHKDDEKNRYIQQISELTGRNEMLKNDNEILDGRLQETQEEANKLKIEVKDKKQGLGDTQEELISKDEELKSVRNELNSSKSNLSRRDAQFRELEEKFLQSSVHVMEEAMISLKNENSKLSRELKTRELEDDSRSQLRAKQEEQCTGLIAENAELSSKIAELKSKLESEVRLRDSRESKGLLDSQEMVVLREKEQQQRERVSVLGDQLTREKERFKSVSDKLSKESQDNTTLELRISTLNHRITELKESLSFANESANKIRKQSLLDQEKNTRLQSELSESRSEVQAVYRQLAECEYHVKEVESRCEALSSNQSRKWLEFSKMADSMKELSHSMLIQSTHNTKRPASNTFVSDET